MAQHQNMGIAIVESNSEDLQFIRRLLEAQGDRVYPQSDPEALLGLLEKESLDAVVISLDFPDEAGLALVHHVGALHPQILIIVTADQTTFEAAASARALGAQATLYKPLAGDDVLLTLEQLKRNRAANEVVNDSQAPADAPAAQHKRLSLLRRGHDLLACENEEELFDRFLDTLLSEISADAVGVWLNRPDAPAQLTPRKQKGQGRLPITALNIEKHHHGPQIKRGKPFLPSEQSNRLWIPMGAGERLIGLVLVDLAENTANGQQTDAMALAEIMTDICLAAVRNIRRLEVLEQSGIKDSRTSAYTATYFSDFVSRQIETARRHGHRMSIGTLTVENWSTLSSSFEPLLLKRLSSRLVEVVLNCIRDSDMIARISNRQYYLLFPETGNLGALTARRRLLNFLEKDQALRILESRSPLGLNVGIASFPNDAETLENLLKISRERARAQQKLPIIGARRSHSDFWNTFDELLGQMEDETAAAAEDSSNQLNNSFDSSMLAPEVAHLLVPIKQAQAISRLLLNEMAIRRELPGVCYLHAGLLPDSHRLTLSASACMVRVLRPDGNWPGIPDGAADIPVNDPRMIDSRFILYMGESQWYGLIARIIGDEMMWGLHFSDMGLVDELIHRLQDRYHLQRGVI